MTVAAAILRNLGMASACAAISVVGAALLLGAERPAGCLVVLAGLIFASFLLGRGLIALSVYSCRSGRDAEIDEIAAELAWAPRHSEDRCPRRAPHPAPGPHSCV